MPYSWTGTQYCKDINSPPKWSIDLMQSQNLEGFVAVNFDKPIWKVHVEMQNTNIGRYMLPDINSIIKV